MSVGEFDATALDDVLLGRVRMGVMAYLAAINPAAFNELAQVLKTTNGNLSTHLRKLEDAGYIQIDKRFEGRRPRTNVHLTDDGRQAWIGHLNQMRALLGA